MDSNRNNRGVHFKPSTEQLRYHQQPQPQPQHQQQQDHHQPQQTWQQRHTVLSKLTTAIQPRPEELKHYQHLKPTTIHTHQDHHPLNHHFGFLIERAQKQQQQQLKQQPQTSSSIEQKLLQRSLRAQIEPSKDLILVRKISDGQSGSVHLVRTRLSSLESLNQSNFYILKKVSKRVSRRIQQYSSIETELSILLLSRSSSTITETKRLPQLHLSFQTETDLHLVLEYSKSGSIADYLEQRRAQGVISEGQLRAWTIDVLAALHWLHYSHRFCHRDVKPSNLLINHHDGHILLTDFATAAPLILNPPRRSPPNLLLQVPRQHRIVIVGTCDYIAPEVLQVHLSQTIATLSHSTTTTTPVFPAQHDTSSTTTDEDLIDEPNSELGSYYGPEIDLWSFGVSLFEIVYNRLPFFCPSINDTYAKIVDHQSFLKIPELRDSRNHGLGQDPYDFDEIDEEDDGEQVPVSEGLQSFLKALLCSREDRIGCGSDGLGLIKKHVWFGGVNWDDVQRRSVPDYTRTAMDINRLGDSVCDEQERGSEEPETRFNFSAFFGSSPGLSTLHRARPGSSSSPEDSEQEEEEEEEFYGFTYLPRDPDEFNRVQEDQQQSRQKLKSSIKRGTGTGAAKIPEVGGAKDDRFSTPIKPAWPNGSSTPLHAPPTGAPPGTTGRGSRSVRVETRSDGRTVPLSQIDQLILLNQIVLSTAKKATPHLLLHVPHQPCPPFSPRPLHTPVDQIPSTIETIQNALASLQLKIDRLIDHSDSIILNANPPS